MTFTYKIIFELEHGQPLSKDACTALAKSPYKLIIDPVENAAIAVVIESIEFVNKLIPDEDDIKMLRATLFPGYNKINYSVLYIGKSLNFSGSI